MIKSTDTLTPSRIKRWAYSKSDKELPVQLKEATAVLEYADLLITFASDVDCPQRALILGCLYSLVGKSVSKHITSDMSSINNLLNKAALLPDTIILNWVTRSRIILRDLRKYDYVEWCEGGFVRKDLA